MKPRVSILVPNISSNILWAATALARSIESDFEAEVIGPDLGDDVLALELATGPQEDLVMGLVRFATPGGSPDDYTDYVVYSENGSLNLGGTNVTGESGANVGGISLPSPPSASPGSQDKIYGENATDTIAPSEAPCIPR